MQRLSTSTLPLLPDNIRRPQYDLSTTGCGIVHIGPGAFHRAHQAVYTDLAMQFGGDWRITAVSMRSRDLQQKLNDQDNLYALVVLDNNPYVQVIGALKHILVLNDQRDDVVAAMVAPETSVYTLTITEKGYCLNSQGTLDTGHEDIMHDLTHPHEPRSAIGLLVQVLAIRQRHKRGQLTIVSCDNLSDNGTKLKAAVLALARLQDEALAQWIEHNIAFPNTMVDSITPATDEALILHTQQTTGLHDEWPIQREAFTQWVIEDNFSGPRPHWEKVGVTFTHDVQLFEMAKLRILNGTHSTLAYTGSLFGFDTVYAAISNPEMEAFIRRLLKQEILPSINAGDAMDLQAYAEAILTRYHNRHIRHMLAQIAWDGSQKLPFRILNTVRDNLRNGISIRLLCVPVAAWILFINKRHAQGESITDPQSDSLLALADKHQDISSLAKAILARADIFAELSVNDAFKNQVLNALSTLQSADETGMEACLNAL